MVPGGTRRSDRGIPKVVRTSQSDIRQGSANLASLRCAAKLLLFPRDRDDQVHRGW